MELVAASKMRKAQIRMSTSRPYAQKIRQVIAHVASSHTEYHHPYLTKRENIKRVGYIVVSTDRGLCGSLNISLFRLILQELETWSKKNVEIDLCLIGHKGIVFFRRISGRIIAQAEHLGDAPIITDLIGVVNVMLKAYIVEELDALYIGYNEFVSTMAQKPRILQLLPIEIKKEEARPGYWDYIYEPEAKNLLSLLSERYIETQVYQSVVENIACEQAARMVAMKNATENAGDLINELQLMYNKARQAAITREIAEIVAGAAAIV
jgi:F-type H+-transporting ATPase subunit gamma